VHEQVKSSGFAQFEANVQEVPREFVIQTQAGALAVSQSGSFVQVVRSELSSQVQLKSVELEQAGSNEHVSTSFYSEFKQVQEMFQSARQVSAILQVLTSSGDVQVHLLSVSSKQLG
jgi:hypothetical protein